MKKILMIIPFLLLVSLPVKAGSNDTWIPQSQIDLCESLGAEYGICPELLEAIIERESSGKMEATNGSCYGICQINGAVWGYDYDTEEKDDEVVAAQMGKGGAADEELFAMLKDQFMLFSILSIVLSRNIFSRFISPGSAADLMRSAISRSSLKLLFSILSANSTILYLNSSFFTSG